MPRVTLESPGGSAHTRSRVNTGTQPHVRFRPTGLPGPCQPHPRGPRGQWFLGKHFPFWVCLPPHRSRDQGHSPRGLGRILLGHSRAGPAAGPGHTDTLAPLAPSLPGPRPWVSHRADPPGTPAPPTVLLCDIRQSGKLLGGASDSPCGGRTPLRGSQGSLGLPQLSRLRVGGMASQEGKEAGGVALELPCTS